MKKRFRYHYAVAGLPFILWQIPFYQKNHYTCSSYIARLLEEAGVCRWNKHFSLVTPRDFMEYEEKEKVFEGSLRELTEYWGNLGRQDETQRIYPVYGGTVRACREVTYER